MEHLPGPSESNPWLAEILGPRGRLRHTDETDGIGLREAPTWGRTKNVGKLGRIMGWLWLIMMVNDG